MPRFFFPLFTSLAMLLSVAGSILPCDVPVFRYALERWSTAEYRAVVRVSERDRSDGGSAALDELLEASRRHGRQSPLAVEVSRGPGEPGIELLFPLPLGGEKKIWSGKLDESSVRGVLDSPARRELAGEILDGATAVWVLVESGEPAADEAARETLERELERAENMIELPEALEDVEAPGAPELVVRFPVLSVSRDDPEEELLVAMLESSEDDLRAYRHVPMAFPVYGRGRLLYALVGDGINARNIGQACAFLAGPCACEIKDDNPGMDLLILAGWADGIGGSWVSAVEGGGLSGLAAMAGSSWGGGRTEGKAFPLGLGVALAFVLLVAGAASASVVIVLRRRKRG